MPHEKLKCGWLNALTCHTTRSPPPLLHLLLLLLVLAQVRLAGLVHLHLAAACAVCIDFSQPKSLTTHRMSHVQQRGVAGRFREGWQEAGERRLKCRAELWGCRSQQPPKVIIANAVAKVASCKGRDSQARGGGTRKSAGEGRERGNALGSCGVQLWNKTMTAFGLQLASSLDAINVSICDSCTMEMELPDGNCDSSSDRDSDSDSDSDLTWQWQWQWPWLLCASDSDSGCSHCQLVSVSGTSCGFADLALAAVAIAFIENAAARRDEREVASHLSLSLTPFSPPLVATGKKGHYNLTYKADIRNTKNCTFRHCRGGSGVEGGTLDGGGGGLWRHLLCGRAVKVKRNKRQATLWQTCRCCLRNVTIKSHLRHVSNTRRNISKWRLWSEGFTM